MLQSSPLYGGKWRNKVWSNSWCQICHISSISMEIFPGFSKISLIFPVFWISRYSQVCGHPVIIKHLLLILIPDLISIQKLTFHTSYYYKRYPTAEWNKYIFMLTDVERISRQAHVSVLTNYFKGIELLHILPNKPKQPPA